MTGSVGRVRKTAPVGNRTRFLARLPPRGRQHADWRLPTPNMHSFRRTVNVFLWHVWTGDEFSGPGNGWEFCWVSEQLSVCHRASCMCLTLTSTARVSQLGQLVVPFHVNIVVISSVWFVYTLRKVNIVFIFPIILSIFRPRERGLPHEHSSAAGTLGLWVRVPLKPVCVYVWRFSVLVLFWVGREVVSDVCKEEADIWKNGS